MGRQGAATLPLHSGSAPRWLFDRMVELGEAISELIIEEHGQEEFLRRLADPYWFQAFGCVLGFDWHSSGLTTTTMGALKEALTPEVHGVLIAGGKGKTSKQTPTELHETDLDISGGARSSLAEYSRLSAMVDNACVQDSFTLYHHTMVVTESGDWCVVQQGMNESAARRYHWLSGDLDNIVVEPHNAICTQTHSSSVLDLVATESEETRNISLDLVKDDPSHLLRYAESPNQSSISDFATGSSPSWSVPASETELSMPNHHDLSYKDISKQAINQLEKAYELQPESYEDLIGIEGVGPKSLRALALIAELVYEAESSHSDPAKYAYAHGGKDGTPHPVDRERYDRSIDYLQNMVEGAELDSETKQQSLKRLKEYYKG